MKRIRILGLDCGSTQAGISVLDVLDDGRLWEVKEACVSRFQPRFTFPQRIAQLAQVAADAIELWEPSAIVIEDIKFNKGNKFLGAMGKVAMAIGGVMVAVSNAGYNPVIITATQARGKIKAKTKDAARATLNKRFAEDLCKLGYPEGVPKAKEDITDALVLCYAAYIPIINDPDLYILPGT